MAYLQSSLHFSRALKSSSDPPKPGDLSKIVIAQQAWTATSFHVPNKSEIIVDFILTRLLKDRTKDPLTNSVLDVRYWNLLADIITPPSSQPSIEPAFAHKAWLIPLLNKIPLAPIVTSLLQLSSLLNREERRILHDTASRSLTLLWPLGVQKCTIEVLMECYGAMLLVHFDEQDSGSLHISCLVASSLRSAFSRASHKKKVYQTFLQAHFASWVQHVHRVDQKTRNDVALSTIYAAGIEVIFNADTFQQISEDPASSSFFTSLTISQPPSAVLYTLPLLFRSFSQTMHKHRTLSGQGQSSAKIVRSTAMKFFSACEVYLKRQPGAEQGIIWAARLELLEVVEADNLLITEQPEGQEELQDDVRLSENLLGLAVSACTGLALRCLCVISRIDHDLVEARIPSILSSLLRIPLPPEIVPLASEFLSLCLVYHSKARTLPTLLSRILACIANISNDTSLDTTYTRTATSPLLSRDYLSKLSKAVGSFFTPGQVLSTAEGVLSALKTAYEEYTLAERQALANRGVGSRKRSRKSDHAKNRPTDKDVQVAAVSFAHTIKVTLTILQALPRHIVAEGVQEDIHQSVRIVLRGTVRDAFTTALQSLERKDDNDGQSLRQEDASSAQMVGAAALRFIGAMEASDGLGIPNEISRNVEVALVASLDTDDILPEFYLEIARFLLRRSTCASFIYRDQVINSILTYLETHLPIARPNLASWSGLASELGLKDGGREAASIGLLRLVLDKYLPLIEVYGSAQDRERVIELVLKICADVHTPIGPSETLSPSIVVVWCLHSAQFWEQLNIRSSFMASVYAKLETLDNIDVSKIAKFAPQSSDEEIAGITIAEVDQTVQVYNALLFTPGEYLSRSARTGLLRRAITLDFILTVMMPSDRRQGAVAIVRTFVLRLLTLTGSAEHTLAHEYLQFLIRTPLSMDHSALTLDIIQCHFQTLMSGIEKGSEGSIIDAVDSLKELPLNLHPLMDTSRPYWAQSVIRRFMGVVAENSTAASLPEMLSSSLMILFDHVIANLRLTIDASHGLDGVRSTLDQLDDLDLWTQCISFGSWIGAEHIPPPGLGLLLTQAISSSVANLTPSDLAATVHTVFSLLLSELNCYSTGERQSHLNNVIAAYVIFSTATTSKGKLDIMLSKAIGNLAVPEFSYCLELVQESLLASQIVDHLSSLIHLASLMLQGAPEGTLKVVQSYMTRWLIAFINYPIFTASPTLRLQVLRFIQRQCSDRPASIRPINTMTIWSLLSRVLAGTSTKDPEPTVSVFHEVVSIVSALVRLRRDLILNTLPHLCSVLRQLVLCLRGPRPHLGAKQHSIVAGSLPAWIGAEGALGVGESQAFARLLTTLTTKTVVRVHGPAAELQKPESLARPLSKYVAYVLQACIEALNDPLCVLPTGVRHEMQPGLFALCEMLNEHARDALMVSALDAGGKAVLKAIWRDYEKQRYVGKG